MIFFPQLATEALVQYPLRKRVLRPAIRNILADGTSIEIPDFRANQTFWRLQYSGLSDAERAVIESFLDEVRGRLKTFVFVEPCTNLLRWSDRPGEAPWVADPLIQVAESGEVLSGSKVHRIVNSAQSTQLLKQVVATPGNYRYCFSLDLRAMAPSVVEIKISSGGASVGMQIVTAAHWRKHVLTGVPGGQMSSVQCEIHVPAGAILDIARLQLEVASAPSAYQKTTSRGHIYAVSRLQQDQVHFRTEGVDNHALTLEIVSQEEME
jgi:hypothetical protein